MQKFYVNNLTSNKLSMSDEAFKSLDDNKIKNLYVTGKMKNSNPSNLKKIEIEVLKPSQQKEYVDYFIKLNSTAIRPEYLEILKPSIKKYYDIFPRKPTHFSRWMNWGRYLDKNTANTLD